MTWHTDEITTEAWRDTSLSAQDRADALLAVMDLEEKVAQLYGVWIGAVTEGSGVAPHQNDLSAHLVLDDLLPHGVGQLTRSFGTAPVEPATGAEELARTQRRIVESNRWGIPAIAHEECLAGFTTWGATIYPVPLSWGATFDPPLIKRMAEQIGGTMRSVGVHQGLAPVLDVTVDPRWGRTEETIGEDPYLVGVIGTAYVQGLESSGIVATLKHFAGYSASRAARNLAPVSMGPREVAEVLLPPFEMAVIEGGARSVMHSYADIDGVPTVADRGLLTGVLRDAWGFAGTVVSDYFGIPFLKLLHGVAETWGDAAVLALTAGVDVELPAADVYRQPLLAELRAGRVGEDVLNRATRRVLLQKAQLGLLDPDWDPTPPALRGVGRGDGGVDVIDLDRGEDRALAAAVAERALVLLENHGVLPLESPARIAVIGPCADDALTMLGCYAFPNHVGVHHPELPIGVSLPTVLAAIIEEFPDSHVAHSEGCAVDGSDTGRIADAAEVARTSDIAIVVVGDRSGLFGGGTSGEGCDAPDLALPGVQQQLVDEVLDAGVPTVVVVVSGRPYALGDAPERAASILQAFLPGEAGGQAIAGVLSGRVNPSGRLPVSIPRQPGAQPATYLGGALAQRSDVSHLDPTARYPFGHGGGYAAFEWSDARLEDAPEAPAHLVPIGGESRIAVTIENAGSRRGSEVVQLYLHDPVASTVRPVQRLIAFARVDLDPSERTRVVFVVPTDVSSLIGIDGARVVEPGALEFRLGASSGDIRFRAGIRLTGTTQTVDHTRRLHCDVTMTSIR